MKILEVLKAIFTVAPTDYYKDTCAGDPAQFIRRF